MILDIGDKTIDLISNDGILDGANNSASLDLRICLYDLNFSNPCKKLHNDWIIL